jgi:hypothetical protein
MKRLLMLTGLVLALVTTTTNNAQGGIRQGNCHAPIIVSN